MSFNSVVSASDIDIELGVCMYCEAIAIDIDNFMTSIKTLLNDNDRRGRREQ